MKVHNFLPLLLDCLKEWETLPPKAQFEEKYCKPMLQWLTPLFADMHSRSGRGFYSLLKDLDWAKYREEALHLDPRKEEVRVQVALAKVEKCLGLKLGGDVLLFGGFSMIDGYARFEKGEHCVYLGVDESHGRGAYLDVLIAHELTHVGRESRPEVWTGFGLDPKMTHDDFALKQPVIEHLFSEGFSCAISEILVPTREAWTYAYQDEDSLSEIMMHAPALDRVIHAMIEDPKANYKELYRTDLYSPELPRYAHYVWAWQWVKSLIATLGKGDPKLLLSQCSADFKVQALAFKLGG